MGWIKCSERMPEIGELVLTCHQSIWCRTDNGEWCQRWTQVILTRENETTWYESYCDRGTWSNDEVDYWMPLPPLPPGKPLPPPPSE